MTSCNPLKALPLLLLASVTPWTPAAAEDGLWSVHIGVGRISLDEKARVEAAGNVIPGASIGLNNRLSGVIEVERYVSPAFAVAFSAGLPVKQTITGKGTIMPYGVLGRINSGPAAATFQWRPWRGALLRPYVGAGVAYLHVFNSKAGSLRDLDVSDDIGPVVQAGLEIPVKQSVGLFLDAKRAFLRTDATGSLGGTPIAARVRMDPVVLHAGLAISF